MEATQPFIFESDKQESYHLTYHKDSFDRVALPKYDKIGEKRGDEILRKRLADPTKSKELACVLEKIDGSHFAIYVKRIPTPDGESVKKVAFCYSSGSKLLDGESNVLFGDAAFYRKFIPQALRVLDNVEQTRDAPSIDFIAIYCEVFGDAVMKRVDYGIPKVDLVAYALYVRDKTDKKRSGFIEYVDCRKMFEGTTFPFLLPLFEGPFDEAFRYSDENRNKVIGERRTPIEGYMLTMLQGNLRLKHKSDEFIRLEAHGRKGGEGDEGGEGGEGKSKQKKEEEEVLKRMSRGTYYSVMGKLGTDYALEHPEAKKKRFELKKAMAEDAFSTWKEETESLESRNDESPQLKEGRPASNPQQQGKQGGGGVPKALLTRLLKEAEVVLVELEKEMATQQS